MLMSGLKYLQSSVHIFIASLAITSLRSVVSDRFFLAVNNFSLCWHPHLKVLLLPLFQWLLFLPIPCYSSANHWVWLFYFSSNFLRISSFNNRMPPHSSFSRSFAYCLNRPFSVFSLKSLALSCFSSWLMLIIV